MEDICFTVSLKLWQTGLPSSLCSAIRKIPDKKITKQRGLKEEWAASWINCKYVCECVFLTNYHNLPLHE